MSLATASYRQSLVLAGLSPFEAESLAQFGNQQIDKLQPLAGSLFAQILGRGLRNPGEGGLGLGEFRAKIAERLTPAHQSADGEFGVRKPVRRRGK
ncbi:hypothetical protein [Shinella sp.]|uniref:hypothetical protein n=1 Tax=Shinella sp. TaxID=1870904 RepID=UPI0040370615